MNCINITIYLKEISCHAIVPILYVEKESIFDKTRRRINRAPKISANLSNEQIRYLGSKFVERKTRPRRKGEGERVEGRVQK